MSVVFVFNASLNDAAPASPILLSGFDENRKEMIVCVSHLYIIVLCFTTEFEFC